MKVAVCLCAKMENHYIREWVEHYNSLGVDNIFIYDNNDVDGERFEDVINDYIENGYVSVIDFRGKKEPAGEAYSDMYTKHGMEFDWICFFDCDEFLMLDNGKFSDIKSFLGSELVKDADIIKLSWKIYGDSGHVRVENGDYSVVNRFTEVAKTNRNFTKAIVRGKNPDFRINFNTPETIAHVSFTYGTKKCVNALGEQVKNDFVLPEVFENAWINHYTTKTMEEYVTNKRVKGGFSVKMPPIEQLLSMSYFFKFNEKTDEKEELFLELTGNKKLTMFFYLYVWSGFTTNIAVKVHEILLKRYYYKFDELNFVIAADEEKYYSVGEKWVDRIVGDKKCKKYRVPNTNIREVIMLRDYVAQRVMDGKEEAIFFGHTKGIIDVTMPYRSKESVLRWIISMYYYNLDGNNVRNMISSFKNGYEMYGSLLTHFKESPNTKTKNHNCIYIGTFYWLNAKKIKEEGGLIIPEEIDRFAAENLPMTQHNEDTIDGFATGPNNIVTENTICDLYYLPKENWESYLSNYGDERKLFRFQNEVIDKAMKELEI